MSDEGRLGTRVNLTLPDEVIEALDALAAATESKRATVIRGWLETAVPVIWATAEAVESAKRDQVEGLKQVAALLGQASGMTGQMELEIKAVRRRAMRRKRDRSPAK